MLSILSAADFALLRPHLEAVRLPVRHVVEEPNKPIKHVYFPEAGIISVVAVSPHDRQIEVALIGREGMSGVSIVLGDDRTPHSTYVQVAGVGVRITADHLRQAMRKSPTLQRTFLRFAQAFMTQTAHTAVANGRARIEERLARWLLMAHDRLSGDALPLTHEFLALMLGVRRAGVTVSLNYLKKRGIIRSQRGQVLVLDYDGLNAVADGLYGVPETEYLRLIGWRPPPAKSKHRMNKDG
jgi:CRP-like cAMP-binding protein